MTHFPLDKTQLVESLAAGCKPPDHWRIGTEHEKFLFTKGTLQRFPYDGPIGIRTLLETLQTDGWEPVKEDNLPIALKMPINLLRLLLSLAGSLSYLALL
jgi:gamma-glutamylcysteine synthetase